MLMHRAVKEEVAYSFLSTSAQCTERGVCFPDPMQIFTQWYVFRSELEENTVLSFGCIFCQLQKGCHRKLRVDPRHILVSGQLCPELSPIVHQSAPVVLFGGCGAAQEGVGL